MWKINNIKYKYKIFDSFLFLKRVTPFFPKFTVPIEKSDKLVTRENILKHLLSQLKG